MLHDIGRTNSHSAKAPNVVSFQADLNLDKEGLDDAYEFASRIQLLERDPELERRLVRKIDFRVFPMMCLVYMVQYIDKVSNSYASVMGLQKDMHMHRQMYAWTGTAFYLGYLTFIIPAGFLLQRFPLAKVICLFMLLWGVILIVSAFVFSYRGFIALRVILGMLESCTSLGFILLTSQWYLREEQLTRIACWAAFNGIGKLVGAAITLGLVSRDLSIAIATWRLAFIIFGAMAIVTGLLFVWRVPDSPLSAASAKFFTNTEKNLILIRLKQNQQGVGTRLIKRKQLIEGLCDIRTWVMFLSAVSLNIPNGGVSTFFSLIMSLTFQFDSQKTLLMIIPAGFVEALSLFIIALLAAKSRIQRLSLALITTSIAIIGTSLLAFSDTTAAKLTGYYLLMCAPGCMTVMFSLVSSNVAGHTKKVFVGAVYLLGYGLGNVIGPQTFRYKDAPDYIPAKIHLVAWYSVNWLCLPVLYVLYRRDNAARDHLAAQGAIQPLGDNDEFTDLTDKENLNFRYIL